MKTLMAFFALFALITQAQSNEHFSKRFNIVKDSEGKVLLIKDRTLEFKFSIIPFLRLLKTQLTQEQALLKNKSGYETEVVGLFEDDSDKSFQAARERMSLLVRSLNRLENIDVEKVFNNNKFLAVMDLFEKRIQDGLNSLDPTIVANLENPTFFYKRRVIYQASMWALDFAKKKLSSIPILNTASYVIKEIEALIRSSRTYHQNILLHYLENLPESELGMTHEEVNKTFSSIYESKIDWFAYWESQAAAKDWQKFGISRFYAQVRAGKGKLRQHRTLYTSINERINFAFQKVIQDGNPYIVNLIDSERMLKSNPAIALDINNPKKIARKRTLLKLGSLGLSFAPLPNFIKQIGESWFKSFYASQELTEGALFAHFESKDDEQVLEQLGSQYANPYDSVSLGK